jgi:hypothetical protein
MEQPAIETIEQPPPVNVPDTTDIESFIIKVLVGPLVRN